MIREGMIRVSRCKRGQQDNIMMIDSNKHSRACVGKAFYSFAQTWRHMRISPPTMTLSFCFCDFHKTLLSAFYLFFFVLLHHEKVAVDGFKEFLSASTLPTRPQIHCEFFPPVKSLQSRRHYGWNLNSQVAKGISADLLFLIKKTFLIFLFHSWMVKGGSHLNTYIHTHTEKKTPLQQLSLIILPTPHRDI